MPSSENKVSTGQIIITVIVCLLILACCLFGTLTLAKYKLYKECDANVDFWCWNDWKCNAIGTTVPLPQCTYDQIVNGQISNCFGSVQDIYKSVTSKIQGNDIPCAFPDPNSVANKLCLK